MTKDEFTRRITAMTQTLYRVSYGLLRSEADREDAVQETILTAWEKLPTLRHEEYFQSWVVRILINQCHGIGRRISRTASLDEVSELEAPPPELRPMRDAVLALPEDYRLAVILHYVEGYGVGETARLLHVPVGTVKSRLYRAREILKREWEESQSI